MKPPRLARIGLALALAGLAGALAAGAGLGRPRPTMITPPPAPPPMPQVALAQAFVRDAAAFRSYMLESSAISPDFASSQGVGDALRTGAAYEPGQLRRGAIVYAAAAALTDQPFVAAVREAGATPQERYAIVARIFANPANALVFADAARAEGLAKQSLAQAGLGLLDDGARVKQAAYDIQRQPWSLAYVADPQGRNDAIKALSSQEHPFADTDEAALDREVDGDAAAIPDLQPGPPPYSGLDVRAVALAALAAIGQADDDAAQRLGWLTDDYFLDHCLSEAKLALYECLAVAKPNYEDVFCLGQHAMKDTGSCVARSADGTVPLEIEPLRMVIPRAHVHAIRARHARRRRRA